jgi:hypothetical protein
MIDCWCLTGLTDGKSSTHYLSDTIRVEFSTKDLCTKRRILFYRLGSE